MSRFRSWLASPGPQWATTGRVLAISAVPSVLAAIALVFSVSSFNSVRDERRDRIADTRQGSDRDQRIRNRVGRVERRLAPLCRRSAACRAQLEAEQQARQDDRRQRRDNGTPAPDQRADRPPRIVTPPDTPSLDGGDGGDDPPTPPGTPTPSTPPSSPNAPQPVVQVDIPPVDLDGDKSLLPQLLPDLGLPPVDVPPVRLP